MKKNKSTPFIAIPQTEKIVRRWVGCEGIGRVGFLLSPGQRRILKTKTEREKRKLGI